MTNDTSITLVSPRAAIPGAEILIQYEGFENVTLASWRCLIGQSSCRMVGASKRRTLAIVPDDLSAGDHQVRVEIGELMAENGSLIVGSELADDLHPVGNPAFDPVDGSLFVTRSGSRGQQMPVSIFRISTDGELDSFSGDITNPSGLAFDRAGDLYVSSRMNGSVYRVNSYKESTIFASDLGVATGIAFNRDGDLFVGDRSGIIHRVTPSGSARAWATMEPSVSAYHLAFGPDDMLYVAGPTVSSYDSIMRFDESGRAQLFFKGLGRPQGLAFDSEDNLYVAASYRGRRGIVRITPDGKTAELAVAGMNVVGLCFSSTGELVVATNNAVFGVPIGSKGTLLP